MVKGWAIFKAAQIIKKAGYKNFYIDCGGDIQVYGKKNLTKWRIGVKNPFKQDEIVKAISLYNKGVATSGNYIRGNHIYNPKSIKKEISDIVSITVIGPNIYDADRFATAAFAMGKAGIQFIESLIGFEGFMIDNRGVSTQTNGFDKYVI
jgi:thiamine biosynthesis lipoprotein